MKKFLFTSILLSIACSSFAQWTTSGSNIYYNSGSVGIGTVYPASNLHVWELTDSKPGGVVAPTTSILKLSRAGTPNYSYNESAEFRIGHGGPAYWGSQLDLFLNGASNQTNVPDQQVMTWLYNGNVGIGTTSPTAKLSIVSNSSSSPLSFQSGSGGAWTVGPNVGSGSGDDTFGIYSYTFGPNHSYYPLLQFNSSNGNTLLNQIGGNVAIGTSDPQGYKLAVNGSAIATSMTVKLNSSWPDFVFKKDYQLPSLAEVKTYIDQNHHLPDMPSEKEVIKDGINLGEMNKVLTRKVEELTLYLIDKDKQVEQLQVAIKQLKNDEETRIAALESALVKLTANK